MEQRTNSASPARTDTVDVPGGLSLPLEVRVHGRGGQGGVTCAKLIAAMYTQMGLHVQTFGDYGSERSGAPVQAYTRVDHVPITNRNKVYRPDHLLVLDEGLMGDQILSGASAGAVLLLNSHASLQSYTGRFAHYQFGVVDATDIAREHGIGSSSVVIINTTMLGAYARMLGIPLAVLEKTYASMGLSDDLDAARDAWERVSIREADHAADIVEAPVAAAVPADVVPMREHTHDIPATLKTGTWSNQAPAYREHAAPCNVACPAGNDIVGFIQALKSDGLQAAAAILMRTQALPSVCGRVCPAPCMKECNRGAFDGAVNIRSLERWIGDQSAWKPAQKTPALRQRFAIVGGGPAGLSAAYQLALLGHAVTIYEAGPALGGVLRNGIPAFRLPMEVLNRDIERILSLGVKAECNRALRGDELAALAEVYDGVVICTGFGPPTSLGAGSAHLAGVEQGLEFLDRVKQGGVAVHGHVVVVGGGNTAIDCARSALRCGAVSVKLVYRRGREEMPAIREEIEDAEDEGVRLVLHRQPVGFTGNDAVDGVVLAEVEPGPPDESGRRRPVVTDRILNVSCDKVLLALGQQADKELLPATWEMRNGRAWQGDQPLSVWFAGDCATGDGTVTHAIGNGRRAALQALTGETMASGPATNPVAPAQVRFSHFEVAAPHKDKHLPAPARRSSFVEYNLGLAGPEEADRCFSCGHCTNCDTCLVYCPEGVIFRAEDGYRVDEEFCKGCGMCVAECPRSAMEMINKNQREASICR
ncbi:MAG TPA: 2-oxoacid:acceptor oxidoreductase family protein [Noviherbaspirillum sp.]|uniref:2-oxoacid:acceptor oxidoreductase family protein n=1 Tax=Noviherbaspirillum sp. TaxID=1926288 RepID=UPI002B49C2AA|nr:2-oxoacid:acceptor oxidoreductase family protein [Noviherbaspirillum sp.]HJV84207.1 2-oxoacid:acceptor oxidoreductase family protein [Noviherbaspirillum sp.]